MPIIATIEPKISERPMTSLSTMPLRKIIMMVWVRRITEVIGGETVSREYPVKRFPQKDKRPKIDAAINVSLLIGKLLRMTTGARFIQKPVKNRPKVKTSGLTCSRPVL